MKITWLDFDLEKANGCLYDFISVYDGSHMSAPRLLKACGDQIPAPIVSSGSVLTFEFKTDGDTERKGFHFRYECRYHLVQYYCIIYIIDIIILWKTIGIMVCINQKVCPG